MSGMKSQDLVVLLKLASLQDEGADLGAPYHGRGGPQMDPYSARSLEAQLGISKTEVNDAMKRSLQNGLARRERDQGLPAPHRRNLNEFLAHGVRFAFPAELGPVTRGLPTAFSASMLEGSLHQGGDYIYVWADEEGRELGQAVKPLFKSVPFAARQDDHLYEYLALVDAIRLGNTRERGLARDRLSERLLNR
jgi:hypothetical protein